MSHSSEHRTPCVVTKGPWSEKELSPAPTADTVKTQWCGIYATWVWAQAGLKVRWRDTIGPISDLNKGHRVPTSNDKSKIAAGDIIVDGTTVIYIKKEDKLVPHHPHVLRISDDHATASVLQGNYLKKDPNPTRSQPPKPENQTQSVVNRRDYSLGPINYYYSVDSYCDPGVLSLFYSWKNVLTPVAGSVIV